jgi:integrase
MSKVDLPYLQRFADRHGKARCYYRRSGLRQAIDGAEGSPEWLAAYQRIHASFEDKGKMPATAPGTFGHLVEVYFASPEFKQLKDSTKGEYRRYIESMRLRLAPIKLIGITKKIVTLHRNSMQDHPSSANTALRVFKTLLGFAVSEEMMPDNPARLVKPLRDDGPGWAPWPETALERFARDSQGASRVAFFLALYTGQRRADVLAMTWAAVTKDGGIMVKQSKGGAEMWLPIHPALAAELAKVEKKGLTIVGTLTGAPYSDDGFGSIWCREQKRCDCSRLPFHGLRKNATNALFEVGCTPQQVMAITGHKTLQMVQHYGQGANQKRLAKQAMVLLTNKRADGDGENEA